MHISCQSGIISAKEDAFMNLLCLFGLGSQRILNKNHFVPGAVSAVSRCWWLKVNTRPVRRFPGDGAVYPHIITFTYPVDNLSYTGKLYIPLGYRVPQTGETISVYYDPENPKRYACYAFGPAAQSLRKL